MIRALSLSGVMLAALSVGGCTMIFRPIEPEASTPMGQFDRAEQARSGADRSHPACRADRNEPNDPSEGCRVVVRKDR